ncbi:hypothetical protein QTG54_010932 [Skeletonema marinoi]|uniref:Uncharacterized protein n=1 Tax=Skeletonema marinoi TaxID=267567 RepID=A0AAD8Y2D3_9STRA|nr:hypothetical protein QTG54_010932 [Skeletonema marinoi]
MKSSFAVGVFITFCIHQFSSSNAFIPAAVGNKLLHHSQITSQKHILVLTMAEENTTTSTTTSNNNKSKSRRLYSFEEARRIARGHGFDSKEEFLEYMCPGAYQIPKDADVVWAESWQGWEDFLGITLSFSKGREVARALDGIETEEAYMALMKSKTIPDGDISSRLPFRPDLKYKEQWQGWEEFLEG